MIALASILYGSVMAFTQTNVRLIAGYSSVAQLGFITAGIFALRADGADGAILQMVNHGLVVAPLFIIVAILVERTGTEDLREMGGMALRAPVLAALFLIVTLATLAMPGSANFIGEFYILNGLFQAKIVFAFIAISRRRDVGLLRAAPLPADDAQPPARRASPRARSACATASSSAPLVALHPRPRALPAADPEADRHRRCSSGRGASTARPRPPPGRRGRRSTRPVPRLSDADPRAERADATDFNAPHIDYAGLSPVIALTVGLCVVLLSARLQAAAARPRPALTLLDPGGDRRAADLAVGRPDRTSSPGRCGSTTWRSRSR